MGESFAIVRAPGAAGVAVQNGNNVHTDWRGYAVVPSLTAYRKNVITLDTESMADDTDVDQQGQTVIPGGGAVVMANYQTHIGNRVLFTLRNAQGPLPFGASARLIEEEESGNPPGGMVADGGQAKRFSIPVFCPTPTDVRIGFFGVSVESDTLALSQASNSASGVGVKLTYGNNPGAAVPDGTSVKINEASNLPILKRVTGASAGTAEAINFNAQYVQTDATVGAGTANSMVTFALEYN